MSDSSLVDSPDASTSSTLHANVTAVTPLKNEQCQELGDEEQTDERTARTLKIAQHTETTSLSKLHKLRLCMLAPYHYASWTGRRVDVRRLTSRKLRARIDMLFDADRVSTSALVSGCPMAQQTAHALLDTSLTFFAAMLHDHQEWRRLMAMGEADASLDERAFSSLSDAHVRLRPASSYLLEAERASLNVLRWPPYSLHFIRNRESASKQLNQSIRWLNGIVDLLKTRRKAMAGLSNAARPVFRMVPDVFRLVLEYVADAEPPAYKTLGWMRLAQVSRQFRRYTLDASALWARDMFKMGEKVIFLGAEQKRLNNDILTRAGGAPLIVETSDEDPFGLNDWSETEAFLRVFDVARLGTLRLELPYAENCWHWRFELDFDPELARKEEEDRQRRFAVSERALKALMGHLSGDHAANGMLDLERLDLVFRGTYDGVLPALSASSLPKLRKLVLVGFFAPITLTGLESLQIIFDRDGHDNPALDTLLDVLEQSPRLSTLLLSRYSYEGQHAASSAQGRRIVTLPNLVTLLLTQSGSLLEHLHVPAVRSAALRHSFDERIPADEAVSVLHSTLAALPPLFPLPTPKMVKVTYHRTWDFVYTLRVQFLQLGQANSPEQESCSDFHNVSLYYEGRDCVDQSSALRALSEALGASGIASTVDTLGLFHESWEYASDEWCQQVMAPFVSVSELHIFDDGEQNALSRLASCADALPALTHLVFTHSNVLLASVTNQNWAEVFQARVRCGLPILGVRVFVDDEEELLLDALPLMVDALQGIARIASMREEETGEENEDGSTQFVRVFELSYNEQDKH